MAFPRLVRKIILALFVNDDGSETPLESIEVEANRRWLGERLSKDTPPKVLKSMEA